MTDIEKDNKLFQVVEEEGLLSQAGTVEFREALIEKINTIYGLEGEAAINDTTLDEWVKGKADSAKDTPNHTRIWMPIQNSATIIPESNDDDGSSDLDGGRRRRRRRRKRSRKGGRKSRRRTKRGGRKSRRSRKGGRKSRRRRRSRRRR